MMSGTAEDASHGRLKKKDYGGSRRSLIRADLWRMWGKNQMGVGSVDGGREKCSQEEEAAL